MKTTRSAFALLTTVLLLAASCGGGDDLSEADAELASALEAAWAEDGDFEGVALDCVSQGFVTGMGGAEAAEGYGVTVENIGDAEFEETPLSESDARGAVDAMWECDGFEGAFFAQIGPPLDADQQSCLADNVDDDPLKSLLTSSFMGAAGADLEAANENVFEEQLFAALETCGIDA